MFAVSKKIRKTKKDALVMSSDEEEEEPPQVNLPLEQALDYNRLQEPSSSLQAGS